PQPARSFYGPFATVDAVLEWHCERRYLIPVEGGLYWMKRPIRDSLYRANSRHTSTTGVYKVFTEKGLDDPYPTIAQLTLLVLHHDRIARHYYFDTFIESKDPQAFFEYV